MSKYVMIMDDNGIPLFSVSYMCGYGRKCDDISIPAMKNPTLLSAFLGGVFGISKEMGGTLNHVSISNMEIFACTMKSIIAIWITEPLINPEDFKDNKIRVKQIAELFYTTYEYYIINNKQNKVSIFAGFQKVLEDSNLVDENANFKKNCLNCTYDKACPYRILTGNPALSIENRVNKIPKRGLFTKLSSMFKSMKGYKPITEELENDKTHNSLHSLSILNKNTQKPLSFGYGCYRIPHHRINSFEVEFITGAVKSLIRKSNEVTLIEIKYSPIDKHVAYGFLHTVNWGVLAEYNFNQKDDVDFLLRDILNKIESLLAEIDNERSELIILQMLDEEQPIFFCDDCLANDTKNCFTKHVLIEMIAGLPK